MNRGIVYFLVSNIAWMLIACDNTPKCDFPLASGIEVGIEDETGAQLTPDSMTVVYTTDTGLSEVICSSPDSDQSCGWIRTSTDSEATYTITVSYAGQEISKTVEFYFKELEYVDECCGPIWNEYVEFEFTNLSTE